MAKVNVNSATSEELVEVAGLRQATAEAIVQFRGEHGGKIDDLEALKDLKGIGDATVEHLREVLRVGEPADKAAAKRAADKGADEAHKGAEVTAFAAKSGADTARKAAETVQKGAAEVTAFAAKGGADAARRTAEQAAEAGQQAARAGAENASRFVAAGAEQARRAVGAVAEAEKKVAERSSEAVSDLGGLFVGLVNEQVQHNVETFRALARARSFREAMEVQNGYLRASVERATQGSTRYVEVVSKLVAGMVTVGRAEAREAA